MYQYRFPHPAVTTDAVVFTLRDDQLQVLLIRRAREPFKGMWALPGGFVDIDEDLDACVYRELQEEAGLSEVRLHQFRAFGEPGRDPRERIITIAYFGLIRSDAQQPCAGDDAAAVEWQPVHALPELTADHRRIIEAAREVLLEKLQVSDLVLDLMPERFGLPELQHAYERLLDTTLDAAEFRSWVLGRGWIEPDR